MTSELFTTDTAAASLRSATPTRRRTKLVALAAVGVLALTACNSDPGAKRVAEDIIETAIEQGDLTEEQGKCMFDKVELYSEDELKEITKTAADAGPGTAIQMFEADLAACK